MIPKIIHYCWLSNDEIPVKLQECMKSWEILAPEYQFIKWDFTRFDINSSEWVKEAFESKKYAFAADYIRLFAVYNYGGIYLDMDMEVVKKFDDLLQNKYLLAYERENGCGIEAGCFGAEKGAEFIGKCLAYYEGRHFIQDNGVFDQTPLPKIMQKEIDKSNFKQEIYSSEFFTAKSYDTGIISRTESTYSIHHFAGSWKTEKEKEIIENTQFLSKKYGYWLARNISQYKYAFKNEGLFEVLRLTIGKIRSKMEKRAKKNDT